MPYIGSSPNFGAVESQTITTANGSTATFTLNQFVPDSDSIIVTVGNVVQEPTTAYSAVGTTITFTENIPNGDTIVIRYLGRSVDVPTTYTNINRFKFVATGGQNTFQNNDANGLELSYTAGNIDVFMNGVRLDESDFTASNGTSVVLVTNASASDEIIIIAYKSVVISNGLDKSSGGTVSGTTVFSGQTTFSGQAYFSGGIFGDVSFDAGTLKIDSGNNRVGVNTNSPATLLHVNGSGTDYIATFQNTTSATGYGVLIKEPLNASAGYPLLAITDGQANTVRFRVDSSTGHVGVNRAPTSNDTVHINDTTPRIKLEETSSGGSKMLVLGVETDGTPFIDAPQSGGNIEFKCVGIPAMQITRTGDTNNPAEFRIKCGSGSLHQCITGTNWGYSTGYEAFMLGRDDTASEGTFSFGYNPRVNPNGGFTGDGREVIFRRGMRFYTPNAANTGFFNQFTLLDGVASGDFNDTSDEKLKQNIKDVSEGISIIKKLRPVIFDWKDTDKGNGLGGFIAQEVQKILPNDVMGEEYVAPDKEKDIEGTDGFSINTTSIVAHLTKALQEAIAKIETLEAKVKALEEA